MPEPTDPREAPFAGLRLPAIPLAPRPAFAAGSFDRVLLDAPCSGIGSLRRRPDARWRLDPAGPERLAAVQRTMLGAAAPLVAPGGTLVYSVCTLTRAETLDVAEAFSASHPDWRAVAPEGPWRPWGSGGLLLPQDAGTDGMALFAWRRPLAGGPSGDRPVPRPEPDGGEVG